jgi:hypothetical protein
MSVRKITFASPALAEADRLLWEIGDAQLILAHIQEDLAAEMKRLQEISPFWAAFMDDLAQNQERLDYVIKALKALMQEHQADFFIMTGLGSVSLDLPHGALLYDKSEYVVKPRKVDVLANLERYGFEEAIRRTAAVNWDVLDDKDEWPDAALEIIGTRRETKENYAYEVKERSSSTGLKPVPPGQGPQAGQPALPKEA